MKRALTIATILSVSALGLSACDVFVTADQDGQKGHLGEPCDNGGACQGDFVICNEQDTCVCQYAACANFCCPDGQHCEGDKCVQGCEPQCSGKVCGPDGCGGVCLPDNCTGGTTCNPTTGQCVACNPDCTGKSCGDDNGCGGKCLVQSCGMGNFCMDDDPHCAACDNDLHCGGDCAACTGSDHCQGGTCCHDECPASGNNRCDPLGTAAFETCGDYDADACLEWGDLTSCPGSQTCSNGVCSDQCSDECTTPPVNFCDGKDHFECADTDSDPCLDKHFLETCPNFCDPTNGTCVDCLDAGNCNDGNSCTNDECNAGNCEHPYSGDGAACQIEVGSVMYNGSCQSGECFCNLDDACGPSCHDCSQDAFDNVCIHDTIDTIYCGCLTKDNCSGTPAMYCNTASDSHCEYCNTNAHCGIGCDDCQAAPQNQICINGTACGCNSETNCAANQFCKSNLCTQAQWNVVETGQTLCFDDRNQLESCPTLAAAFYGQDGNYVYERNLSDAGSGSIYDAITGLTWVTDIAGDKTWDQADMYCQTLVLGGTDDWRLPTESELMTIVDRGRQFPAIDRNFFTVGDNAPWVFWSNTASGAGRMTIDFSLGTTEEQAIDATAQVRCVRGPVWGATMDPGTRFQTITGHYHDAITGFDWEANAPNDAKNWEDAIYRCKSMNLDGHSNWRLPDYNELMSLFDYDPSLAKYVNILPSRPAGDLWTSTTKQDDSASAWFITPAGQTGNSTKASQILNGICMRRP